MEQGRRDEPPGILGLVALIEQHYTAVRSDLIARGLRLRDAGSEAFDLTDLRDVVEHLGDDSALAKSIRRHGKAPEQWTVEEFWTPERNFMAAMVDALRWLVWAKSKDAQRPGARPPEPIPRPGVEPETKHHKPATTISLEEARAGYFDVART